jgi:hypothetical protein
VSVRSKAKITYGGKKKRTSVPSTSAATKTSAIQPADNQATSRILAMETLVEGSEDVVPDSVPGSDI